MFNLLKLLFIVLNLLKLLFIVLNLFVFLQYSMLINSFVLLF